MKTKFPAILMLVLILGVHPVSAYQYVSNNPIAYFDPLGLDQMNLFPTGSDGQIAADSRGKPSNEFGVGAHGSPDGQKWQNEAGNWMNAKDLANEILNHKDYDPSKPVKLNICHAGKPKGLAEQLAKELGNTVIASPGTVDTLITKLGSIKIAWPTYAPEGWKTFSCK